MLLSLYEECIPVDIAVHYDYFTKWRFRGFSFVIVKKLGLAKSEKRFSTWRPSVCTCGGHKTRTFTVLALPCTMFKLSTPTITNNHLNQNIEVLNHLQDISSSIHFIHEITQPEARKGGFNFNLENYRKQYNRQS